MMCRRESLILFAYLFLSSLPIISSSTKSSRWYDMRFASNTSETWQDFVQTLFEGNDLLSMPEDEFSNRWRSPRVLWSIKIAKEKLVRTAFESEGLSLIMNSCRIPVRFFSVGPPSDKRIVIFKKKANGRQWLAHNDRWSVWIFRWIAEGTLGIRLYNEIRCICGCNGQTIADLSYDIKQITGWKYSDWGITVEATMKNAAKNATARWEFHDRGGGRVFKFSVKGVDVKWRYETRVVASDLIT